MHGQCDARPTVTIPAARHHRPLLGERGTCVLTCPGLQLTAGQLGFEPATYATEVRAKPHVFFYGSEQMVLMPLPLQESYWMQKRWSPVWISLQSTWVVGGSRKGIWPKLLPWASKSPTLIGTSESLNKGAIDVKFSTFISLIIINNNTAICKAP